MESAEHTVLQHALKLAVRVKVNTMESVQDTVLQHALKLAVRVKLMVVTMESA